MADVEGDEKEKDVVIKSKHQVQVKLIFLKVEDINTLNEQFTADVFIRSKWREQSLDSSNKTAINWDQYWNPKLGIENSKGAPKQTIWTDLELAADGKAYVVERRRVKGDFQERLELQGFPFDVQDLSIVIISELSLDEVEIVEDTDEVSGVNVHSFGEEQEWSLWDFVETEKRITTNLYTNTKFKRSGLIVSCSASRRPGFYVWNVIIIMGLICMLSISTFAVPRNLQQNRLQLTFILILTGITFKFAASGSLPKISYITHLDKYIIGSMIFMFLVCVWHAVISLIKDDARADELDFWAFIVVIIMYVCLQLFSALTMLIRGQLKRKENRTKQQEYRKRVALTEGPSVGKKKSKPLFRRRQTRHVDPI